MANSLRVYREILSRSAALPEVARRVTPNSSSGRSQFRKGLCLNRTRSRIGRPSSNYATGGPYPVTCSPGLAVAVESQCRDSRASADVFRRCSRKNWRPKRSADERRGAEPEIALREGCGAYSGQPV